MAGSCGDQNEVFMQKFFNFFATAKNFPTNAGKNQQKIS